MMILILLLGPVVLGDSNGRLIKVGLAQNQTSLTIAISGIDEQVMDLSQGTEIPVALSGTELVFTWTGSQIAINNLPVSAGPILIRPGASFLSWNSRHYRGMLLVSAVNGRLQLINQIQLEDYLRGVLPKEVSPAWPMAALKAQAIAARTYTVASVNRHAKEGFDLCATTHCQVYGGTDGQTQITDQAVSETANQVMVYKGKIISAMYHSSSGGSTEDPKNIWGFSTPYLTQVLDWDQNSPHSEWSRTIDWTQAQIAASRTYPKIGRLIQIWPAALGEDGKVRKIKLKGDLGETVISGESFRYLLNLPSSDIQLGLVYGPDPLIYLWWSHNSAYPESVLTSNEGGRAVTEFLSPPWNLPDPCSWLEDKDLLQIVIKGNGWGHRVGLSQWGAKGMAEAGFNEHQILEYYYPGITIVGAEQIKP